MNLLTINGVRGYIDQNGVAHLNVEDVSRGLGFITVATSGNEVVRWSRVNGYLEDMGYPHEVNKYTYIPENIFYRLAMKAKNEVAEKFQAQVADEILPTIRKHGAYMTPETIEKTLNDPDFIIGLATRLKQANEEKSRLQAKIEADKPKVLFAESLEVSDDTINVNDLAKLLKQNGVDIGELRLFKWLRENGYLIKSGSEYNMPTQKSMNLGLFKVKVGTYQSSDGTPRMTRTPKVTGKGQMYFINKFKKFGDSA